MSSLSPVKVVHGTDQREYNLGGRTVRDAVALLNNEVYAGALTGLSWMVNGQRAEDIMGGADYPLKSGDTLTFMSRGGDKGVFALINVQ